MNERIELEGSRVDLEFQGLGAQRKDLKDKLNETIKTI